MNGNCDGVLSDTLIGVRYFSNLTRVDENGRVACSAMALARGLNVKDSAMFQSARKTDVMTVSNEQTSRVTGQPVIGAMLALRKPDGSFDGTVATSLDVHWIDYMMRAANLPKGAVVTVFDRSGKSDRHQRQGCGRCDRQVGAGRRRPGRCRQRGRLPRRTVALRQCRADRQHDIRRLCRWARTGCSAPPICM